MPQALNPLDGKYYDVTPERAQYWETPLGHADGSGTQLARNPLDGKLYPVTPERAKFWETPGNTLADTYEAPAMEQPQDDGVELADYGKSILSGGASVGQGFGWLAKQVGAERIGSTIEELGRNAVDYWNDSLSDAAKDALSREFITRNESGDFEWGDPTLNTVGLMGAQSLLGTAAGMGVGAGVSKVLQIFANPFGRSVLAAAAKSGSIQAARKLSLVDGLLTRGVTSAVGATKRLRAVDSVIGALGFGVGEGVVGGAQAGQSVEAAVKLLPPETLLRNPRYQQIYNSTDEHMSELERHQYAADTIAREAGSMAGWQAGLVTSLLGAPMGAYFGRLIGQSGRLASSRLASAAMGAGGEAAQEALQSGAEAVIGVNARQQVGEQDLDMLETAINEAIGGAAAGGLLGGAVGAVDFQPDVPRGTSPGTTGGTTGVSTGAKPDTGTPLKNAAMRAAQSGADRAAVLAEVQANDRPLLDRIGKLNKLAAEAAALPPAPPAPPTFGDVLVPQQGDTKPKERTQPSRLDVLTPIDEAAHSASTSPLNPTPPPTPEQIESENYEAGRVKGADVGMRTLDFVVEYPRGTQRGDIEMRNHYGRIPGTVGGDGMALDFFMGNEDSDKVYLYHHLDGEGRFAQHKALVNMSRDEADATLREFYRRDNDAVGPVVEMSREEFEQWVASGNVGAPHPRAEIKTERRYEGQPTRAVTAAGESINAKYALVEAGDLVSSHTLTGRANSRFPQELQPRDRSRAGLRQWITETAARFEPALSVEGVSAGEGAPIVGPDGVVESGNGRMMLITKQYLDKQAGYRTYLEQNAEKFGFTKEQVGSLARPVLVRVRQDPMDMAARARFATEANRPTLSTFSATEQANADARTLTNDEIAVFAPGADGNVLAQSNDQFVRSFVSKMPATERAGLMTSEGQPTRQLANRIQAAVFARAYQDDRMLTLMAEEANPDVRTLVSALTAAAPAFARARAVGALAQADVVGSLLGAVDIVRRARNTGQSVEQLLAQQGLFGQTPPNVERMARFIDTNIRSGKRMGEAFTAMASFLETETLKRSTGSMFEEAPLTVETAMLAASQRMEAEYGAAAGQGGLFDAPPARPAPAAQSRTVTAYVSSNDTATVDDPLAEPYDPGLDDDATDDDYAALARETAAESGVMYARPPAPKDEPASRFPPSLKSAEEKVGYFLGLAEENKRLVDAALAKIDAELGSESETDIKKRESILGKAGRPEILAGKPWFDVEYLRDVFRFKSTVSSFSDIPALLERLMVELGGNVEILKVDTDKALNPKAYGWRFFAVDMRLPNGQMAEWYAAPRELIQQNSKGDNHKIFERWRKRDIREMGPADIAAMKAEQAESWRTYDNAFRVALQRAGEDESAVRAAAKRLEALGSGITSQSITSPTDRPLGAAEIGAQAPLASRAAKPSSAATKTLPSSAPVASADIKPPAESVPNRSQRVERSRIQEVRRWIEPELKALEPLVRVYIVDNVSDLPYPDAPPDVEGAYTQDRAVYFVANNILTEARAREVARHEVFGHMAIERVGRFKVRLEAVGRAIRAGNLKDLVREVRRRQGLLPAMIEAREVVALMAERGVKSPLLDGMRTALREVGRDLGLQIPLDAREVTALVGAAARDFRRDAAMMRDFQAAAGVSAVRALSKAEPSDQEILAAIDAIYEGRGDYLDNYRRAPSGKRVPPRGGLFDSTYQESEPPEPFGVQLPPPLWSRPYGKAPNSLMGFGKNQPPRGFEAERYPLVQVVRVTFESGESFVDAIKGLNRPHALERARRNWDGATIEPVGDMVKAKDFDPASLDAPLYSRAGNTPALKKWFGKSKVVDENGEPLVVYHGTAGDFEAFDPARSGVDSDLGAGIYFTNEPGDVAQNYATTRGPDITARYERRLEDVTGSIEYDTELAEQVAEVAGKPIKELTDEERDAALHAFVRREMAINHDGLTMPVYLKMENPLVLGGDNETFLTYESPLDENGDFTNDESGTLVDALLTLRGIAEQYGNDIELGAFIEANDVFDYGGAKASAFFEWAKSVLSYVEDDNGQLIGNELVRQAFEDAGYDGIIDHTVDVKFGSQKRVGRPMEGMSPDTTHYVVFRPAQVKSAIGNRGTFDPKDPRITYSRAGALPGSVPDEIRELLGRVMAPPTESLSIKDRVRESVRKLMGINTDAIRQGVIDSFDAVKQAEKGQFGALLDAAESPYKAALATRNLPSVMAAVMLRGAPVYKDGAFQLEAGRKGIIEIFQPVTEHPDGNLLPMWELYAAARRERDVMRTKKDYTPLFSNAERLKALALEHQYPVLEQARKEWEEFNGQVLDLAAERGVLDPAAVAAWKQNFYVPFYRAMEEAASSEGPGTKKGLEGHGGQAVKKRLRGSEKPLGHVFENLVMNTAYLIDESFKNTAMQKIAAMSEGVAMERIPLKFDAVQLPAGQLEKAIDQLGGMVLGFKDDPTSPTGKSWQSGLSAADREEWVKLFRRVAPVGKGVVSVFEGGKPVYYRVTDDLLLRSISNMGHDNFEDVFGLFRGSKRLLTSAITMDPAFMAANWVRDTLSTWVSSDAGIVPIVDALKGAKAAFSMDSDTLAIMAGGGGGGGIYDMQPEDLRKFLVGKLGSANAANRFAATIVSPKNWLRVWRKIGNAAENANRVAVYKAVRAAGGTVAEAVYQARDVLNFAMHGDYAAMRWLTATVPFMNARVQGLYRLWRGAHDNPKAFALKGMMLTAATLALLLRNNDEEEYERLPEWDKDMYWHMWIGGEHYRLPKPFEVGAIFGTIPERMYRLGSGRDSADIAKQRIMSMFGDTFAFNPIPQVAKPLIEQYANRSFFFGSPIVGMAEQNLNPEAQYNPWTSESIRALAEGLPDFAPAWLRSPQRLEAMLRGYLGATGMYALQAADTLARPAMGAPPRPARNLYDMPVVKRFLQSPTPRSTKYGDQLYDMLEEANSIFRTVNRYREQGRTLDAQALVSENMGKLAARGRLNRIATQVRAINNQMQLLYYNQTMSPEQKRTRVDELTAKKNELTALVAPMADAF